MIHELIHFVDATTYHSTGLLLVVLGVLISIRVSGYPDLTVDGSFTVGAALYAVALVSGWGTAAAFTMAILGGAIGGAVTWAINQRLGVGKVIAGVLSMIILILSAPYLTSSATKSLLRVTSIHTSIASSDASLTRVLVGEQPYQLHILFSLLWFGIFVVIVAFVMWGLRSRVGVRLRYSGDASSPVLVPRAERSWLLLLGLASGNALVAVGGAVEAERRGGYTANMGLGILLVALAVLVLGEAIIKTFRRRHYLRTVEYMCAVILGCVIYSAGIQALLLLRIQTLDLRLMTALLLVVLLGMAGRAHSSTTRLF